MPRVADQGPEDGTPGWRNPGWRNPGWRNPGWRNPGWRNPGWRNPGWRNPGWRNPGWRNPGISDDTAGGSRQISAAYTNTGNTTSSYDARVLVSGSSTEYRYQLIVYKLYTTTPDDGCDANLVGNTQVLVNIPDYDPYVAGTSGAVSVASAACCFPREDQRRLGRGSDSVHGHHLLASTGRDRIRSSWS